MSNAISLVRRRNLLAVTISATALLATCLTPPALAHAKKSHKRAHAKRTHKRAHRRRPWSVGPVDTVRSAAPSPLSRLSWSTQSGGPRVSAPRSSMPSARVASGGPGPSGQAMPVGNIPGWTQVFADNFPTNVPEGGFWGCSKGNTLMTSNCAGLPSSVAAKWWAYPDGWRDTAGNGVYEPSATMDITGGMMNIYVHTTNGVHYVAAPVPKIPGGVKGNGLLYGRYEIRFRADEVPGYKTAWLLWPDSGVFPQDGEIDFPEADLNTNIWAYMHWMGATANNSQDAYPTTTTYGGWHTATIDWTQNDVTYMMDGTVIGTSTAHVPSTPMHWILQTETSTYGVNPAANAAGNVQIAWVVAYTPG